MVQSQEKQQFTVSESSNGSGPWIGLICTNHSLGSADSGHLHEGDLEAPLIRRGGEP